MTERPVLVLRIISGTAIAERELPSLGSVSIGRSRSCDVSVDDGGISRKHALLHVGPSLRLEDLGGANGIRLCHPAIAARAGSETAGTIENIARQLAPQESVELPIGATFQLGTTVFVVDAKAPPAAEYSDDVVVRAPAMREVYALAERFAEGTISVLLLGETGVGKEVLADFIVRRSPRAKQPFIRLNCAAFSDTLLESELFGYEKGAFTGAVRSKPGLFEAAHGGSVFLDEVGEMPASTQVKLLRVLEAKQVLRVGAIEPRSVDVRVISATNVKLEDEVNAGRFREDLFFRLNGATLRVPPLRERVGEIAPLARMFATKLSQAAGRPVPDFSDEAVAALELHPFRGNVRELRNIVERGLLLCGPGPITARHLDLAGPASVTLGSSDPSALKDEVGRLERQRILETLAACDGNQSRAAKALGISRTTLLARLEAWGVERPRKGR